jgi:hypothetical protein
VETTPTSTIPCQTYHSGKASLNAAGRDQLIELIESGGIRLEASQVVCQPALSDVHTVKTSGLIPERLRKLLDEMSSATMIDQDKEDAVRAIIEEDLSAPVLRRIIELAAAHDTALDGDDGPDTQVCKDLKKLPKESLTGPWWLLEYLPLQSRVYNDFEEEKEDHSR